MIKFFYKRKLFCNVMTVFIFIVGIMSMFHVRRDLFPAVDFDLVIFTSRFTGASPEQVENMVINPTERLIREVSGIKEIESISTVSLGVILVTLDPDARDPDKIIEDLKSAVNRVEDIPDEATELIAEERGSGSNPVITISLSSSELSQVDLRDWTKKVAAELELISGVSSIKKDPWPEKEVIIVVKKNLLQKYHVSLTEIINAIKAQNVQLPGGSALDNREKELAIKTDGEFKSLQDVENTVIRSNIEGYTIKVKDVATVSYGLSRVNLLIRLNSERSFLMAVKKHQKADALSVTKRVKKHIKELEKKLPSSIHLTIINDRTKYLKNRLQVLSTNMLIGILLIIVILTLFLPFRIAIVVAIGIPFAILCSISTIYLIGRSINLISLIGLIIVSGMLVDDVVIIIENIYRKFESKLPLSEAIITGTSEMVIPVLSSVMTTMAAFSPLMFMSGIFGKFIFEIPLMVIIALFFSVIEGFFIAPVHFASFMGDSSDERGTIREENGYRKKLNDRYNNFLGKYEKFIELILAYPYRTLSIIFLFILGGSSFIASKMDFVLFPDNDAIFFYVQLESEPGTSVNEMEKFTEKIEKSLGSIIKKEEIQSYTTHVGLHGSIREIMRRSPHFSQILVELVPANERNRSTDEIIKDFKSKITIPPEILSLTVEPLTQGPPQGKPVSINIAGDSLEVLKKITDRVKAELKTIPGVTDIIDSDIRGKKEIQVIPNQVAMRQAGLSVGDIASTVRGAFEGVKATNIRSSDEDIAVRVQMQEIDKTSKEQLLKELKVGNKSGTLIPLSSVADFKYEDSNLIITRENYKRRIRVTAQVEKEKITPLEAMSIFKKKVPSILKGYPDYSIYFGGAEKDTEESLSGLKFSAMIALMLIFLILLVTFNSFWQPLLILLTIPMGFVGAVWALILHGKPISFMSSLGIIALAGVIVNNGIVFIDFYNRLIEKGMEIKEALIKTATVRLRPIILTSITTIFGLLPTAYGIGGRDVFVMTICLTMAWGLGIGLILTTLTIPPLLIAGNRIEEACKRRLGALWQKLKRKPQ